MRAYNLVFVTSADAVPAAPLPLREGEPSRPWGWWGELGPGIRPSMWPLSSLTGLPMRHLFTLRLPQEYQRRGPGFPGIAFFRGHGQFAQPYEPVGEDDPFDAYVRAAVPHPQLALLEDLLDQQFGLIWLTEEELTGARLAPPADTRRPGEHVADDEGHNAWDGPGYAADWAVAPADIYLTVRDDPNTGLTPEGEGYRDPFDLPVWDRLAEHGDHLGGSLVVGDGIPEPMTPWFLQVQRVAEYADYGNGEATVIDLESHVFFIG